jgi:hypothetical protein
MSRPTKEYQAFTSLVDRLLTVSKEELDRRMVAYKAEAGKNPSKPGPKPKKRKKRKVKPSASRASRGSGA